MNTHPFPGTFLPNLDRFHCIAMAGCYHFDNPFVLPRNQEDILLSECGNLTLLQLLISKFCWFSPMVSKGTADMGFFSEQSLGQMDRIIEIVHIEDMAMSSQPI